MALIGVIAAGATVFMLFGWLRTRHLPLEIGTAAAGMDRRVGTTVQRPTPAAAGSQNGLEAQPAFTERLAPVALMDPQKVRS